MGLYPHHLPQPHTPPTGLPRKQVTGPGRRGLLLSSLNYLDLSSYPETEPQALLTLAAATGAGRSGPARLATAHPLPRCSWVVLTGGGQGSVVCDDLENPSCPLSLGGDRLTEM